MVLGVPVQMQFSASFIVSSMRVFGAQIITICAPFRLFPRQQSAKIQTTFYIVRPVPRSDV